MLPGVALSLSLNFAQGLGLVNRRLLDRLDGKINFVSGEDLVRVHCTERIFIAAVCATARGFDSR